jgi:hypothetical protein
MGDFSGIYEYGTYRYFRLLLTCMAMTIFGFQNMGSFAA